MEYENPQYKKSPQGWNPTPEIKWLPNGERDYSGENQSPYGEHYNPYGESAYPPKSKKKAKADPAQQPNSTQAKTDPTFQESASLLFGMEPEHLEQQVGSAHSSKEMKADEIAKAATSEPISPETSDKTNQSRPSTPTPEDHSIPGLPKQGGTALPKDKKAQFEPKVGDLSDVQVHRAPKHAKALGASAFTVGRHVYMGEGADDTVLQHELGHFAPNDKQSKKIRRKASDDSWVTRQADLRKQQALAREAEAKRIADAETAKHKADTVAAPSISDAGRKKPAIDPTRAARLEQNRQEAQKRLDAQRHGQPHSNLDTSKPTAKEPTLDEIKQRYRELRALQAAQQSAPQSSPPAPLFPVKPDLKLATAAFSPGMLVQKTVPQTFPPRTPQKPAPQKLAQVIQQRVTSNKPLSGNALKVEAIRQTFGCSAAVAQQLLDARRQTGKVDGLFVLPSSEMPSFLSSSAQYQYNLTLSQSEYAWYFKYVNTLPSLRDADLNSQKQSQQRFQAIAQGANEQMSAFKTYRTLENRGNYGRLTRRLNQEQRGQDRVPTDLDTRRALLSPAQAAIYDRKLHTIQKGYGDQPITEFMRQSVWDQVQFETRLDVMEIRTLGRSLDDKRRGRLEKLYASKSETFKEKAEQSVAAGFQSQYEVDPVFGKETAGKVKRTLRDRYLIQSDRRAMEIAYLGKPLSAQQRKSAEAFYEKLTPEQKQVYAQKSQAEFDLMWGSEPPNAAVSGQMKWVLRAQQMEQDFAGQVYRAPEQAKPKAAKKPTAAATAKGAVQAPRESNGLFDAQYAKDYYQTLFNQGNKEHNLFKLAAGTVGGGITNGYLGFTGLAEQGVKDSLDLAHQGQAEGGLSGALKTGLGYGLTFIPSQFTQERAPGSMMGLATVPLLSAGAATKFGQTVLANPFVQQAVLPTLGFGGVAVSGKQMGDAATGKDLLTGEKLNEEERVSRGGQGVLGVAGSFSLLEGTGKNIINGAKGIPAAAKGSGQKAMGGSPELALPNGGKINPAELELNQPIKTNGNSDKTLIVGNKTKEPVVSTPKRTEPQAKATKVEGTTPEQAQRFEQVMQLSKAGDRVQAAQRSRELKAELGPERYQALQQEYLASQKGSALRGNQPQAGERNTTQVEYKKQSSATRLFPGEQSAQNCGLQVCQQFIRASTGVKRSEAEMAEIGKNIAGYDPEVGTSVKQIPKLLRTQGVGANTYANTPETIQIGVENRQGVLSNNDAGLLRTGKSNGEAHAVHVTDVIKNKDGEITAYVINDTGTGEAGRKVPKELFERSLMPPGERNYSVLTDEQISLGGRTASQARIKAHREYAEQLNAAEQKASASSQPSENAGKTVGSKGQSKPALARVTEPGSQIGKLKSYRDDADVPARYRNDPRFKDLASDPDHAGAIKSETRAEAMAGLEAEAEGLIPGPIKRGPKGTEFYDAQGRPWDVKAPPSPSPGEKRIFESEAVGSSIRKELRLKATPKDAPAGTYPHEKTGLPEPRRVILDSSYMTKEDHKNLWKWLDSNLTSQELKNIVEVNTK